MRIYITGYQPIRDFWGYHHRLSVRCELVLPKFHFKQQFLVDEGLKIHRYVECTSAAIQGLVLFTTLNSSYKRKEIVGSINKAVEFIEKTQLPDGSWSVLLSWFLL